MAFFSFLVGGPYSKGGKRQKFGHCAMRVSLPDSDNVYDFGRYGNTSGMFQESGEGILQVWRSFPHYIAGENALRRVTTQFVYEVPDAVCSTINTHFSRELNNARVKYRDSGRHMMAYILAYDYFALGPNCTTLCIDSGARCHVGSMNGSMNFYRPGDVLNFAELFALKTKKNPEKLFLPANLQMFLQHKLATRQGIHPAQSQSHGVSP